MFEGNIGMDSLSGNQFVLKNNNVDSLNSQNTSNPSLFIDNGHPKTSATEQESMTPLDFRKSLGLSGTHVLTGSAIGKDGSNTDIYQLDNGTGEIRVKTSKDKNTTTYTYYKYDFSQEDPIGVFTIKKWVDESGQVVGYSQSFIDNLNGIAAN